jgi:hypothetical protein
MILVTKIPVWRVTPFPLSLHNCAGKDVSEVAYNVEENIAASVHKGR